MTIAIDLRAAQETFGGIPSYTNSIVHHILTLPSRHTFVLFTNSFLPSRQRQKDLCANVCLHAPKSSSIASQYFTSKSVVRGLPSHRAIIQNNTTARIVSLHIPNKLLTSSLFFRHRPFLDHLVAKKIGSSVHAWFAPNLDFISLSRECKLVLTIHDLSFLHFPAFFSKKMQLWHTAVRPDRLLNKAAQIIAVSQNTKHDILSSYGIPEERISVIYHAIETADVLSQRNHDLHAQLNLPAKYILMSGASCKRKNLITLLRAWGAAKQTYQHLTAYCLIVTGIPKHQFSQSSDVRYYGCLPRHQYQYILRNASALVYPSFYEGFGLPLLEAFAAYTPVIASAHSSLSEIGGEAYYPIDPYNIESLSRAIGEVVSDTTIKEHLCQQGIKQLSKFSWEVAAKKTLQIFDSLS